MTSVVSVHEQILRKAAQIANDDFRAWELTPIPAENGSKQLTLWDDEMLQKLRGVIGQGDYFRPIAVRSDRPGFGLRVEFNFGAIEDMQIRKAAISLFHTIGKKAVRKAIIDQKKLLAGIILGEARRGRNYFDLFRREE